jgi:hypothetical protein
MKQGKSLVDGKNYEEGIKMLNEAFQMEKWKEIYGGQILANLSMNEIG